MKIDSKNSTDVLVVHYAEIGLKKGNRHYFEDLLARNEKIALGGIEHSVRRLSGRHVIVLGEGMDLQTCARRLSRVFGISSIAIAKNVDADIEAICDGAVKLVSQIKFGSFAVRARRSDKRYPINSQEANCIVGAAVQKASGARVDLTDPELTVSIELLKDQAFVYCDSVAGPGGLPAGVSGRVACLISGGIDSPVAAWRMMKRGCLPFFIHFHSAPFTSADSRDKAEDIVRHLLKYQPEAELAMVPFGEIQKKIVISVPMAYRVLMYRRFMIRIACELAKMHRARALVTGEALSQVASQTLENMTSIEDVSDLPVFRPLIGMDKQEIVSDAQRIGTYEMSIIPHDDCCSFLTPKHPTIKSNATELNDVERSLDVDALVKAGIDGCEIRSIKNS